MTPELETIQQQVSVLTTRELRERRAELASQVARWVRGAYGEPLPADLAFELDAIGVELKGRG